MKTKVLLAAAAVVLFSFVFVFLAMAFIFWEINPQTWDTFARLVYIIVSFILSVVVNALLMEISLWGR